MDSMTVGTDGACSGNPGPTGWAWVAADGRWSAGALARSTNQAGELLGLLHAIVDHAHVRDLTIESDSAYAIGTYTSWMDGYMRRGWTTSAGKPVSNRGIVEQLVEAREARKRAGLSPVRLVKVKGHARPGTHPLNEAADARAVWARDQARTTEGTWRG